MGKLPETIALLVLVIVAVIMGAQMAGGDEPPNGPFQEHWSLEFRRELAANPPGLLRDLRTAGASGSVPLLALGLALAGVAAWDVRASRGRRAPGAGAARAIGLVALLFAVAMAVHPWGGIPLVDIFSPMTRGTRHYPHLAPGLAVLRLGLCVAVAGHAVALFLDLLSARRAAR